MPALVQAKGLYKSFLMLCDHYGVLPMQVKTTLDRIEKDTYKPEREEKIRMYKAGKAADEELSVAEGKFKQGSLKLREFYRALLASKCFQTLADLEIIPQEMEMLKFKHKLETDDLLKKQYEADGAKPRPKPYFYKLDDSKDKNGQPVSQIQAANLQGAKQLHTCEKHTKMDVLDTLWQPDHAQPKMKMDDFADLEYKLMMEKQERDQQHAKQEEEKMNALNEDEQDDLQKYKDRHWDDWKDAHEKGAGNKKY